MRSEGSISSQLSNLVLRRLGGGMILVFTISTVRLLKRVCSQLNR